MEKHGIIPHYIATVALCLLVCVLLAGYLSVREANKVLQTKSSRLMAYERGYAYTKLQENAINMRVAATALNIEHIGMRDAAIALLRYADYLFSNYGAVVDGDIIDTGQVLQVKMLMSVYPQNADSFINMLGDILSSTKPATQFTSLNINETGEVSGRYIVTAELILTQPYL